MGSQERLAGRAGAFAPAHMANRQYRTGFRPQPRRRRARGLSAARPLPAAQPPMPDEPAAPQRASRSARSGLGGATRVPPARGPSRRRADGTWQDH